MELQTSIAIFAGIFFILGFFAYHSIVEKIGELHEDLRDFEKSLADDNEDREKTALFRLKYVEQQVTGISEGVEDLRATAENR